MSNKLSVKVVLLALFFSRMPCLYSQVTVGSLNNTPDIEVARPPAYDSSKNFPYPMNDPGYLGNDSTLYNGYIGLDLYLPTNVSTYGDAYYTIKDVFYVFYYLQKSPWSHQGVHRNLMGEYINITKLEPHPVVFAAYDQYYLNHPESLNKDPYQFVHTFSCLTDSCTMPVNYLFLLKNKKTGDLIYYSPDYGEYGGVHCIMVPYFIKQQKTYDGKTLVYTGNDTTVIDRKTGDSIILQHHSRWTCRVSVLRESQATLSEAPHHKKNSYTANPNTFRDQYCLYYILSNATNEILIPGEPPTGWTYDGKFNWHTIKGMRIINEFPTEEQYNQTQKDLEAIAEKEKEAQRLYTEQCIKQYGSKYGALIADHKVAKGMTKEMCKAAWGEPYDIFQSLTNSEYNTEWLYTWKSFLYFKDDILILIAN